MQPNRENLAIAARQVMLLSGQNYFRNEKELIDLLVKALVRHADDTGHLTRMVETWIERTRLALHPADVAGLAAETSRRLALPEGCPVCRRWDPVQKTCVVESHIRNETKGGVERCSCERGQKLRELDAERKAAEGVRQALAGGAP